MSDDIYLFPDKRDETEGTPGDGSNGGDGAGGGGDGLPGREPWKVLVVDDEESIHAVTRMSLEDFVFEGRRVACLSAFSAAEAEGIIRDQEDIAMILLDVVMEEPDSGLRLVRKIREELGDVFVRIILRTGQPGEAPEEQVILDYDINDYKEKTDLTARKLRTAVASALRSYQDLVSLEEKRRELREARNYQTCIINAMHSVLFTVDEELRIKLWNRTAEGVFHLSRERAVGRLLFDAVPPAENFADDLLAAVETGRVTRLRETEVYLEGPRWVDLGIYPVIEEEKIIGAVILAEDLTERKEKDRQLQRSQKMEALGSLAAGLAHDINNVLVGITGPVSLLELEYPSEHLEMIKDSARRACDILRQFLRLSVPGEADLEPVDLRRVLDRVMGLCRSALDKSVAVHTRIPGEPAVVRGNKAQLEQVILNLCLNGAHAMTAMREGERMPGGELILALELSEGGWRLTVADEGVGIAPENLEKIFEPFFTTKGEDHGTGLGLSMVKTIVDGHGGTVRVDSEPGEGTAVVLEFPRADAEASGWSAAGQTAGSGRKAAGSGWKAAEAAGLGTACGEEGEIVRGSGRILLCDDENIMRLVGQRLLSKCGYEPILASSGEEALEIFEAQADSVDAVILDVMMPDWSGMEVFRRMKEIKPDVKVLLTSGFGEGERIEQAREEGVLAFLPKPYTLQKISAEIAAVLGRG